MQDNEKLARIIYGDQKVNDMLAEGKPKKVTYITKLRADRLTMLSLYVEVKEGINDLRRYLNSGKFQSGHELDGYVNVKDVLDRLRNIEEAMNARVDTLEFQPD